jgi:hypothetical protein
MSNLFSFLPIARSWRESGLSEQVSGAHGGQHAEIKTAEGASNKSTILIIIIII